jgi:glucose dehydrogenase
MYQTTPAAQPEELMPANGFPKRGAYRSWQRSHGDNGATHYSALDQIDRENVTNWAVAWIYHSNDGKDNIQYIVTAATGGNKLGTPYGNA